MRRILNLRKHHYLKRLGIFLIAVALIVGIVGMVNCTPATKYNLTMAVSPYPDSGTAIDLTKGSPYPAGTVVNIQAVATPPYRFAGWIASASAAEPADSEDPSTTVIIPAEDLVITANFVGPLDHFTCYWMNPETSPYIGEVVSLEDQFGAVNATVEYAQAFGNPAEKWHGPVLTRISNPDHHLTVYDISYPESKEPQMWQVVVDNQFGTQNLIVFGPVMLAVPTQKVAPGGHGSPVGLDHFLLYTVFGGSSVNVTVGLSDQFGHDGEVLVLEPIAFANPVQKTHDGNVTEIVNPEARLVFYSIAGEIVPYPQVKVVNQFGAQTLNISGPGFLAVPSEKLYYEPMNPLSP